MYSHSLHVEVVYSGLKGLAFSKSLQNRKPTKATCSTNHMMWTVYCGPRRGQGPSCQKNAFGNQASYEVRTRPHQFRAASLKINRTISTIRGVLSTSGLADCRPARILSFRYHQRLLLRDLTSNNIIHVFSCKSDGYSRKVGFQMSQNFSLGHSCRYNAIWWSSPQDGRILNTHLEAGVTATYDSCMLS
jgi:hypothetical protein